MITAKQTALWNQFKAIVNNCHLRHEANNIRLDMIDSAIQFGDSRGIQTYKYYKSKDTPNQTRKRNIAKLKKMILDVENERLGIRFAKDDIDIMAPVGWTEDQTAEYSLEGFWVIGIGIVVAAAVIAYGRWLYEREQQATQDYNRILKTVDGKLCADSDSETCRDWTKTKKQQNFEPKKSTIETLESGIVDTIQKVKSAASIGLMIAIPLILLSIFGNRK